jgi:hypothetical protein
MAPTSADRDPGTPGPAGLIWTRPPKEKRERPTREAIVAAATGLAGTHGLDAVSIRRVAAALQTRPMDLPDRRVHTPGPPGPPAALVVKAGPGGGNIPPVMNTVVRLLPDPGFCPG